MDHQFGRNGLVNVGRTTAAAATAATTLATTASAIGASAIRFLTTGGIGVARATTGTIITHMVIRGEP